MKKLVLTPVLVLFAALLALLPAVASAQATPSKLVLENSQRILSTLEQRRPEFKKNRGALEKFIASEFEATFDRDYAARQVLPDLRIR